jgi:hypothetical protein
MECTFKPTVVDENLNEIGNDNRVRVVNFAISKKYNVPTS